MLILGVMAASGYYVFMNALDAGQHVTVPSVVDKTMMDAVEELAESGLAYGMPQFRIDERPENTVIAQRPTAGRVVREGRKVTLTISKGASVRETPDMIGKTREEAVRELEALDLQVGSLARVMHTTKRDQVIAQDPPAGFDVAHEGAVGLLLSAGDQKNATLMPSLLGQTEEEALKVLGGYQDLRIERKLSTDENAEEGVVLEQTPQPDAEIYPGDPVTYTVREKKKEEKKAEKSETQVVGHTFDYAWHDHHIEAYVVDESGSKRPSDPRDFPRTTDPAQVAQRQAGWGLKIKVPFTNRAILQIYDNGALVAQYDLRVGQPPKRL